ncbi:restriction endonuclease subunit S [Flavobacterium sp. RSP46]|nr:restriction endonuclease subunit S [Flavobacterium sp. RSP46]RTY93260.1 restriction endonuclease subunit S [Flavobacterium sp. RSP46]
MKGFEFSEYSAGPKFRNGDTLVAKITPCLENGKTAQVDVLAENEVAFGSSEFIVLRENENTINDFIFYLAKSPAFRKRAIGCMEGTSGRKRVNEGALKLQVLPIPDKLTQQKIAKVLSDLDSKIELNNRINTELEAMAKTLYDYWFVQFDFPYSPPSEGCPQDGVGIGKPYKTSGGKMVWNDELKREIPEGWDCILLGEMGNFKNGVNYDPSKPGNVACPIINVRNISASSYFLKNSDLDIIYLRESDVRKYAVHEGSIIIARSGIPGATRLISDFVENTLYCGFAIHYELNDLSLKIPVFFYLKSIEEIIKNGSGGTILKNVNQARLNNLQVILPENETIISQFNELIVPIFNKINLIERENQELASLRDWLLPMLMNGQVSVGDGEEELGMVAEESPRYGK